MIWTNKPGRGYCERDEQGSRIHISAEVDKDQIRWGEDGLRMATFSENWSGEVNDTEAHHGRYISDVRERMAN